MLESIWYFILFFALGVFLPIMVVWALVKLFLRFFGRADQRTGKKAEANIERRKEEIYREAKNDEEKKRTDYFLKHDEGVLPDDEFIPEMRRMRAELRSHRIEKPGMEKIFDFEGNVVDDGRCLMRRLPNAGLVSSKYRRTLVFIGNGNMAVETLDLDLISRTTGENELLLPMERILEVTAPKWTPPVHVDGRLERGKSWSLKFLLKGGTTKVVKGFPDDATEIAEELTGRVKRANGIES